MRLESALYSSSQGLQSHGDALSVVGDNVSNASTTGYKASRAEFADLYAEGIDHTRSGAEESSGNGSLISDVKSVFEGGTIEYTGRSLDAGIDGNGFFVLSDGTKTYYSRAGNFSISSDGTVINSDGLKLQGYVGDDATTLSDIKISNASVSGTATTSLNLSGNISSESKITSVIENPQTFSQINSAASFIAGDISVYDSLGAKHSITLAFYKTDTNQVTAQAYIDGGDVGGEKGVPTAIGKPTTLTFNGDGTLSSENANLQLDMAYSNGANAGNIALDLSNFTQYASTSLISSINQNGTSSENIKSYTFSDDGNFYAVLEDDTTVKVASVALANAVNNDSFVRTGDTLYSYLGDSSNITTNKAGTGGLGSIKSSSLEASNVDIANQFVNMILYQRGYQANSQVFSTAGTLIENTLALLNG